MLAIDSENQRLINDVYCQHNRQMWCQSQTHMILLFVEYLYKLASSLVDALLPSVKVCNFDHNKAATMCKTDVICIIA